MNDIKRDYHLLFMKFHKTELERGLNSPITREEKENVEPRFKATSSISKSNILSAAPQSHFYIVSRFSMAFPLKH